MSVAQKRCIITSCVCNRSHLAARLCCRRAVLLNARARRSKATHYHELRIRMQPSCGTLLLPPRTVFLSACELRSKATHYPKLRIRFQPSCGTPLLPPRCALERTWASLKSDELSRAAYPIAASCGMHLLPPRTVFLRACERRPKALHSHELRIQSQPSCGTTLLPPRCAVERTRASPQKRRTTMSWVSECSHLAARLCCRRAQYS